MNAQDNSVCAIVVTFNRLDMLRECLTALQNQTIAPDRILVVNNASTDGTAAVVTEEFPDVELLTLPVNSGGAGGFHEGMRWAYAEGYAWHWLMDDDTIPTPTALEALLGAPAQLADMPEPMILASKAVWTDDSMHPMNRPGIRSVDMDSFMAAVQQGFVTLRTATFVSLLVRREAVERYGLPHKHYFIWSDDIEFTARVLREEPGYFVPGSVVHHKTKNPYTAVDAGDRFYFAVRNAIYLLRGDSFAPKERILHGVIVMEQIRAYLVRGGFRIRPLLTVLRGVRDGILVRGPGGAPDTRPLPTVPVRDLAEATGAN